MDIILTISLLASDRRESLGRCLDSLKPLLVKIPSELIIVLTGTDPKVREIAETYTPHIIQFPWRGDFSAARNAGLKEAQGEWFLYIDDDEWFDSTDEICAFFLSGEYRRYHSAHYIQRNYQDWNGTEYSDFPAFRMVRRLPGSRFCGAVHEELAPRMEPCRYFQACVHHYGYVQSAGEPKKTSRNIPLLLQSIEKQTGQVKDYIQLAKEFGLAGDWKSAEEYCREGYAACRELDDPYSRGWLQAYLAHLLSWKPGKAQAATEIEAILAQGHPSELTSLVLYQQLVHLYTGEKEPEKAVRYGWKFEGLLKEMDGSPQLWGQQAYGEFCEDYVKNPGRLYGTREKCAACALEVQDWPAAAHFLRLFPWESEGILCRHYPKLEEWKGACPEPYVEILLGILEDIAGSYGISDVTAVPGMGGERAAPVPAYLLLQKALDEFGKGNHGSGSGLLEYCMAHAEDPYLRQLLLEEAVRWQASVMPLASRVDLDSWDVLARKTAEGLPFALNGRIRVCEEELRGRYPLHCLSLKRQRLVQGLRKGFPLWEELTAALGEYCRCTLEFYKGLYRDGLFGEGAGSLLPAECRFAQTTLKAMEEFRQGRMAGAVHLLGDAYHICPDMAGVVTELSRQAARRLDDPALHAGAEFLQLAGQMKGMLKALMEAGQTQQAGEVLGQLLPLMPEDLALIRAGQELVRRKKP